MASQKPRGSLRDRMLIPTLIEYLKKILDQYPDDGQILKEIIQNAEDAGATKVIFLIDHMTYGTDPAKLFNPSLIDYQGPALYAYNNAVFTEGDWDGIRKLGMSNKADDPLQVGRFGLGFKSVFHITDLPGIYSGNTIGFLDPHEKHFLGKSIYTWDFTENNEREEILELSDQFEPFKQSLFNVEEETFKNGNFRGTIFRFPLRTSHSSLSDDCYDVTNLEQLVDSFKSESHLLLLFVKNIESLEFYRKNDDGTINKLIEIRIAENIKKLARKRRQDLILKLRESLVNSRGFDSFSVSYPLSFDVFLKNNYSQSSHWIVTQYFNGRNEDDDFAKNYLPLVGIATKVEMNCSAPYGQVFCFLPLPLQDESPTGFHFHVHASFAVEQNRRHIKHTSANQNIINVTDKDLLWNNFLMSEVFPHCLIYLVEFLIDWHSGKNVISIPFLENYKNDVENKVQFAQFIYSLLPNISKIYPQWRTLAISFYTTWFVGVNKFFSNYSLTWLDKSLTMFLIPNDETDDKLLISIITGDKKEISIIPDHILDQLMQNFSNQIIKLTTPDIICTSYKRCQTMLNLEDNKRLALLRYFEKKGLIPDMLVGTNLLPLLDSTWICYESSISNNKIYVPDHKYNPNLFPKLLNQFIDKTKIPKDMMNLAICSTQLTQMNALDFVSCVKKMLFDWSSRPSVNINCEVWFTMRWLSTVWKHIRQDHPNSLSAFEGLHLLPVSETKIVKLNKYQAILQTNETNLKYDHIQFFCRKIKLFYIESQHNDIYSHYSLLNCSYVLTPTCFNILKLIILKNKINESIAVFESLDHYAKNIFLDYIASESYKTNLGADEINLLRKLPIFPTKEGSNRLPKTYVSLINTNKTTMNSSDFPVPSYGTLLEFYNKKTKNLAKRLGVVFLDFSGLVDYFYLDPIKNGIEFYSYEETQNLLLFLCKNIDNISSASLSFLTTHKFVTKSDGTLACPSELFDPSEYNLMHLLSDAHFPSGEWAKDVYQEGLKRLGLKNYNNLTIANFKEMAERIPKQRNYLQTFQMFMDLLTKRSHLLNDHQFKTSFHDIKCFPIIKTEPANFPDTLVFEGSASDLKFVCWNEVHSSMHENLIGSVAYLIDSKQWTKVEEYFGWSSSPPAEKVKQHLLNVIQCYKPTNKLSIMNILDQIYSYFNLLREININRLFPSTTEWVWNGNGFSNHEYMVIPPRIDNLSYKSYSLPHELTKHTSLWKRCGIKQNLNPANVLNLIKQYHSENVGINQDRVNEDLQLSISILDHLANISSNEYNDIYIPIKTNNSKLKLEPIQNCAYCDEKWYQLRFYCNDLDDVYLIHDKISIKTAKALNVPSYTSKYLKAEEIDCAYEQSENITSRIRNLLKDYTDGITLFKELIQNADDAGATEISFVYDERQNNEARSILFDEKMKDLQGPAIWSHNDATFTDEDFDNLTKLGGATKEGDKKKIGKFGLGFNSVYHLTDVPIFISKENIVFLDPHRKYLGNAVHSKSCGGMKLNFKIHKNIIKNFIHQFMPFNQMFGCDLSQSSNVKNYKGTLFRFPLRTEKQALESDICNRHYNSREVMELLKCLYNFGEDLIMFTQNVRKINLYHIPNQNGGLKMENMFTVARNIIKRFTLDEGSDTNLKLNFDHFPPSQIEANNTYLEFSYIAEMITRHNKEILNNFQLQSETKIETKNYWIISWCKDDSRMMQNSQTLAIGAVACRLEKRQNNLYQTLASDDYNKSYVYCFLPISVPSTFPVHINGNFAVNSNRTHLYENNSLDKSDSRCRWNENLIAGPIAVAYCHMLHHLATITKSDICNVFPTHCNPNWCYSLLIKMVYERLLNKRYKICKSVNEDKFYEMSKCFTMNQELRSLKFSENIFSVLKLTSMGIGFIDLPNRILNLILKFDSRRWLGLITPNDFYSKWFLPNLTIIPKVHRNNIIIKTIVDSNLNTCLENKKCMPVTPSGDKFEVVKNLIDPESDLALLYDSSEERFPYVSDENQELKSFYFTRLRVLGMAQNTISCEDIVDRCRSIEKNPETVGTRLKLILNQIEIKIKNKDFEAFKNDIKNIRMFPKLKKPNDWILSWNNSEFPLVSINESYLMSCANLPGIKHPIISEKDCFSGDSSNLKSYFDLRNKPIPFETLRYLLTEVLKKFDETKNYTLRDEKDYKFVTDIMIEFNNEIDKSSKREEFSDFMSSLKKLHFILAKNSNYYIGNIGKNDEPSLIMLRTDQCCLNSHPKILPYLCSYVDTISHLKNKPCNEILNLKPSFQIEDYINALNKIKLKFGNSKLDEKNLKLSISILSLISKFENINVSLNEILIPNERKNLVLASELLYNNLTWEITKNSSYCHGEISKELAMKLKLKTVADNIMMNHQIPLPFGQHEDLVDRLNTILNLYCIKEDILKEMIQNADDSGASEIHFILDCRQLKTDKIFDDTWKSLQGPALCIYNNKSFTEQDLKGIQSLGRGSKKDDVLKTGQFGVGFNSVYQITDVPSFITTIENSEEYGTVVGFFDPNCGFVPGATKTNPGGLYKKDMLSTIFTDVYSGYLQDLSPYAVSKYGTLFRLPLRNEKSKEKTKINQGVIKIDDIKDVFNIFEKELYSCLIFLKSISSISLNIINEIKNEKNVFTIKCKLSKKNETDKNNFMDSVKMNAQDLHRGNLQLHKIQHMELIYNTELEIVADENDDKASITKWIVVQRFGFEDNSKISQNLKDEYCKQNIPLIPLGGVAFPENALKTKHTESQHDHFSKVFNLLPLPFETNLPCHINGHFVMSSEGRRDLIKETIENRTFKSEWNELVISQIIVPAYCSFLMHYQQKYSKTRSYNVFIESCDLIYYKLFPIGKNEIPQIKYFVKKFYEYIHESEKPLFLEHHVKESKPNTSWLCSGKKDNIYFDCRKKTNFDTCSVKEIVIRLGMKLIYCPFDVIRGFRDNGVNIKVISPDFIRQYIIETKYLNDERTKIDKSVFESETYLESFLKYLTAKNNKILNGLPVLLSADGYLCTVTSKSELFESKYKTLFPHKQNKFVNSRVEKYFRYEDHPMSSDQLTKKIKLDDPILKKLTISDFTKFLTDFEPITSNKNTVLEQKKFENEFLSRQYGNAEEWLQLAWSFLNTVHMFQNNTDFKFLGDINEYSILPVEKDESNQSEISYWLYPVSKRLCVLKPKKLESDSHNDIFTVLKKIGVPILKNFKILNDDLNDPNQFLEKVVGTVSEPLHVLTALEDIFSFNGTHLEISESATILEYFNTNIQIVKRYNLKSKIIRLPIFHDIYNNICKLDSPKAALIPSNVPKYPIELYLLDEYIFLEENNLLNDLYEHITDKHYSVINYFTHFIFKKFDSFTSEQKLDQLKFLKKKISDEKDANLKSALLPYLKELRFLKTSSGKLLKTSFFYSKHFTLFSKMETDFPNSPYNGSEWDKFLIKCGLVTTLTNENFLEYAEKVGVIEVNKGQLISDLLVKQLIMLKPVNIQFLNRLKQIPFIIPHKIKREYLDICDVFKAKNYIALSNSKLHKDLELYWTVCNLLPPIFENELMGLSNMLNIDNFNLDCLISHMKNMYESINNKQRDLLVDKHFVEKIEALTYKYLEILNKLELNDKMLNDLSNLPIIYVNSLEPFVKPSQCAIDITENDQIPPYLFKLPPVYGRYTDFLMKIGAANKISIEQCIKALETMNKKYGEKKLIPSDHISAKKLIEIFLDLINPTLSATIEKLFIPCESARLESSENVICLDKISAGIDAKYFSNELNMPIFKHKSQDKLHFLPERIRPKLYSDVVKDELFRKGEILDKPPFIEDLENRLTQASFQNGFTRIVSKAIKNEKISKKKINEMFQKFDNITFECVEFIEFGTYWKGNLLENTIKKVDFYPNCCSNDQFLISATKNKDAVVRCFSKYLISLCFEDKTNERYILEKIFTCNRDEINKLLDEEGYESDVAQNSLYALGVEILIEDHFTLVQDIFRFYKGQLVAYEIADSFDDGDDGDPKYVLVQIIQLVGDEAPNIASKYEIDFGQYTQIVSATSLYSFGMVVDLGKPGDQEIVLLRPVNLSEPNPPVVKILKSLIEIISDLKIKLKQIWKLEIAERKRAIKRLQLRWHPDKNPDNIALCTEVFKHLTILIQMLEKGENIDNYFETNTESTDHTSNSSKTNSSNYKTNSSYFNDDYFERMGRRAKQHQYYQRNRNTHQNTYSHRSNYQTQYNNFFSRYDHVPTRKPAEAKLFMDQADHDYKRAENDESSSYQWMCVKYYMVVQNSLKAVHCVKDHSKLPLSFNCLADLSDTINDPDVYDLSRKMDELLGDLNHLTTPGPRETVYNVITSDQALEAKDIALKVHKSCLRIVEKYIKGSNF